MFNKILCFTSLTCEIYNSHKQSILGLISKYDYIDYLEYQIEYVNHANVFKKYNIINLPTFIAISNDNIIQQIHPTDSLVESIICLCESFSKNYTYYNRRIFNNIKQRKLSNKNNHYIFVINSFLNVLRYKDIKYLYNDIHEFLSYISEDDYLSIICFNKHTSTLVKHKKIKDKDDWIDDIDDIDQSDNYDECELCNSLTSDTYNDYFTNEYSMVNSVMNVTQTLIELTENNNENHTVFFITDNNTFSFLDYYKEDDEEEDENEEYQEEEEEEEDKEEDSYDDYTVDKHENVNNIKRIMNKFNRMNAHIVFVVYYGISYRINNKIEYIEKIIGNKSNFEILSKEYNDEYKPSKVISNYFKHNIKIGYTNIVSEFDCYLIEDNILTIYKSENGKVKIPSSINYVYLFDTKLENEDKQYLYLLYAYRSNKDELFCDVLKITGDLYIAKKYNYANTKDEYDELDKLLNNCYFNNNINTPYRYQDGKDSKIIEYNKDILNVDNFCSNYINKIKIEAENKYCKTLLKNLSTYKEKRTTTTGSSKTKLYDRELIVNIDRSFTLPVVNDKLIDKLDKKSSSLNHIECFFSDIHKEYNKVKSKEEKIIFLKNKLEKNKDELESIKVDIETNISNLLFTRQWFNKINLKDSKSNTSYVYVYKGKEYKFDIYINNIGRKSIEEKVKLNI